MRPKKPKTVNDVRGARERCINFQSCPLCYGCRRYSSSDSDCQQCLLENKKLLQFFIHYNLLAEQTVNRLLDQSLQKSDMEIRSMLLNYQDEIQNEDKKEETGSQLDQLLAALS